MTELGKKTLSRPMVVLPMIVTLFSNRHPPSSVTSGPMTQNGPISTSSAMLALASMTASGEILGISSLKKRKLNSDDSQRGSRLGASFGLTGSGFTSSTSLQRTGGPAPSQTGSASTSMNLMSASQAILSSTKA